MNMDAILKSSAVQKAVFIVGGIVVLFWPVVSGMYTIWMEDSNNSHGLLVPFIVLYLIYEYAKKHRSELECTLKLPRTGTSIGFLGLVGALGVFIVSMLTDIVVLKNLSFVISIQSAFLFVFGWQVVRLFIFPLLFLLFMIPVPTTLYGMVALPMQLFATKVSVLLLSGTPLPISAEGNIIRIGNEMLTVAEACSGLRSLMSFIILSLLFAYLAAISKWKKVFLVSVSIPIAICSNIVRIIVTAFIAYIYGSRIATGFIHDASGYVMFVIAFAIFYSLARALEGAAHR